MTATQAMTRHDLEARIVQHSWESEGFRKEFIADPAGAFGKYLQVPPGKLPKIVVHEETAGSWHIVLPAGPNAGKLSDTDLEKVAGGATFTPFAALVIVDATVAVTVSASAAGGAVVSGGAVAAAVVGLGGGW
jgi:hypothetical protein